MTLYLKYPPQIVCAHVLVDLEEKEKETFSIIKNGVSFLELHTDTGLQKPAVLIDSETRSVAGCYLLDRKRFLI